MWTNWRAQKQSGLTQNQELEIIWNAQKWSKKVHTPWTNDWNFEILKVSAPPEHILRVFSRWGGEFIICALDNSASESFNCYTSLWIVDIPDPLTWVRHRKLRFFFWYKIFQLQNITFLHVLSCMYLCVCVCAVCVCTHWVGWLPL